MVQLDFSDRRPPLVAQALKLLSEKTKNVLF